MLDGASSELQEKEARPREGTEGRRLEEVATFEDPLQGFGEVPAHEGGKAREH